VSNPFNKKAFHPADSGAHEIDPVCEMKVDSNNPPFIFIDNGKTYYFCSEACKVLFERMSEKYLEQGVPIVLW